jgi:hypothetical protein
MIERGEADVLSVAYFDRLCRSIRVKDEVVTRVEAAGGRVVTLDHGAISNGSAAQWLSSTQTAAVAEYFARNVSERTADAQRDAIAEGRPIIPRVPPGFVRSTVETAKGKRNGPLEHDSKTAPIMEEVFRRRASGDTLERLHAFMREQGIERSLGSLSALLRNRIYIGEVSYRDWTNPNAHPPLIDRATFERVQRLHVPAGRKPRSERLLSRLGILRCANCGARMSVLTSRKKRKDGTTKDYPYYYCHRENRECGAAAIIRAEKAEEESGKRVVAQARKEKIRHGRASVGTRVKDLKARRKVVARELDGMVLAFSGLEDVSSAQERLVEKKAELDKLDDRVAELERVSGTAARFTTWEAWNRATVPERRDALRAAFVRITCDRSGTLEFFTE